MAAITVRHLGRDAFELEARSHVLTLDQPADIGGDDAGPTPTELFVGSLVACIAFYARRYLARHELAEAGLVVTADYEASTRPSRVTEVAVRIGLPPDFPPDRVDALLAVASHCTVHNSLREPPVVRLVAAALEPVR